MKEEDRLQLAKVAVPYMSYKECLLYKYVTYDTNTLSKIDQRLTLFKEYLNEMVRYRLRYHSPQFRVYNRDKSYHQYLDFKEKTGYMFLEVTRYMNSPYYTFDQWLTINGHEDLIL